MALAWKWSTAIIFSERPTAKQRGTGKNSAMQDLSEERLSWPAVHNQVVISCTSLHQSLGKTTVIRFWMRVQSRTRKAPSIATALVHTWSSCTYGYLMVNNIEAGYSAFQLILYIYIYLYITRLTGATWIIRYNHWITRTAWIAKGSTWGAYAYCVKETQKYSSSIEELATSIPRQHKPS
jgi:hypothetical protein